MKTPLSPSQFLESGRGFPYGGVCLDLMDTPISAPIGPDTQQSPPPVVGGAYSLCEVCNLQLPSAAQAQLHYNGRSHLRRVRQLQAGETGGQTAGAQSTSLPVPSLNHTPSSTTGGGCGPVGGALLGLVAGGGASVMMKPFLSFPVSMETTSPAGLFPNFNTMDPVQKAVINHTFGVTMVPKKKQVISCNVCQLRFNSDSQAEAHYKGSRHAKKVKAQENKAKTKLSIIAETKLSITAETKLSITAETNGSSSCPAGPTPPGLSANSSTNQHTGSAYLFSSVDISSPLKPFSCSSLSCSSPGSSSRSGSEAPPSSPPPASPGHTSSSQALPPTSPGHASSSQAPPPASLGPSTPQASNHTPLAMESEEEKAKKLLYCSLCKVAVNSLSQLEAHNTGSKHKTMLEARSGAGPIKAYPRPGAKTRTQSGSVPKGSGLQNKTFHCQICDVHVNSEIQLKQHISSRRHKDRMAGKPSKPKYSPYNKQQRSSLTSKLQKDLAKPSESPSFLSSFPSSLSSSPLLPPCSLASSLALPPSSLSSSLFAPPSFLRPAPGPIRATQGSILFAPY